MSSQLWRGGEGERDEGEGWGGQVGIEPTSSLFDINKKDNDEHSGSNSNERTGKKAATRNAASRYCKGPTGALRVGRTNVRFPMRLVFSPEYLIPTMESVMT